MYSYEEQCVMDLSDNYTLLYSFLGREVLDAFGVEGERAFREGTRRYGRDRGQCSREKHQALGVKINMKSLFSVGGDLPPDPRFHRELQELNPEERVSHTLVCPMADIWKAYGERAIGRMYCEEFHPACYNHYAFDYGHTNLAKTLTQEKDEYCAFNVVLRAENLPEELKPLCFAEYDPGYVEPKVEVPKANGKRGFETLSIKLYYYLLVIMRRQGGIFLVYLAASAAAWLLSPALVRRFSVMGAAVCYVGLMAALAVGFGAMQAVFFRREKEAEYDR